MLTIALDIDQISFNENLNAKPAQIKQAYHWAVNRTLKFIENRLARQLSIELGIPQKTLKFRIKTRLNRNNDAGFLWVGLNPVNAEYVGSARQTRIGVSVKKHRFNGAFIAKMKNGKIGVFRRKTERPLPLENVKVDLLKNQDIEGVFERYQRQAEKYFESQFKHQLNYVMSK